MRTPRIRRVASAHDQIVAYYKRAIDSGDLPHGSEMPSRREMVKRCGAADGTVSHARRTLTADGYMYGEAGRAAYVIGPEHRTSAPALASASSS